MNARLIDMSWQATGAALLVAWVFAACGLEASGGAAPFSGRTTAEAGARADGRVAGAGPDHHAGPMIEPGFVTHIERIVIAAPRRAVEETAVYRVVVKLENGASAEFTEPSLGEFKVGDRVQVVRSSADPTS